MFNHYASVPWKWTSPLIIPEGERSRVHPIATQARTEYCPSKVFTLGHLFHADSVNSMNCPSSVQGLYMDQVLLDVLLKRQSVSKLSPNRIWPNHEDCMDSWTKHEQTPYELHTA
jgi:hypothetical protein